MSFPWANYKPSHPFMHGWMKDCRCRVSSNADRAGYPVPRDLNYWWNFGFLALGCLVLQIVTGIILAMITRRQAPWRSILGRAHHARRSWGWLMRYAHGQRASAFCRHLHPHLAASSTGHQGPARDGPALGVVIFLLMMATAFMGYALPGDELLGRQGHHRPVQRHTVRRRAVADMAAWRFRTR